MTWTEFEWDGGYPMDSVFDPPFEPDPRPTDGPKPIRRGLRQAEGATLGSPTDKLLSEGFREIEQLREEAYANEWEARDRVTSPPQRHELTAEHWSLLEALYELRLLTRGQIERQFLTSMSDKRLGRQLSRLVRARVLRRGWIRVPGDRRKAKSIYALDEEGFALLRDSSDHHASEPWNPPQLNSAAHAVHDLESNEWLFGFRSLAPRQLLRFLGTRSGKVKVPMVWEPGAGRRPLRCEDLGSAAPVELVGRKFSNIVPDLVMELWLEDLEGNVTRTDFLVENEARNNDANVREKALAYDCLLNGWWREHPRYKAYGHPPTVVFVVPNLTAAHRYLRIFDKALRGHLVRPPHTQTREENELGIRPSATRLYYGRHYLHIAVARDVHQRTLRSWRVPALPPDHRAELASNAAERHASARPLPRCTVLIDQRDLVKPAR